MIEASTIGIDIAKSVFQIRGVDAAGEVVIAKRVTRGKVLAFFEKLSPCLIGMEACPTSHHRARAVTKLAHDVRLMPANYVKAYVKRNKNDANDAAAICEAVTRPSMRFVAIKTKEQQAALMLHRPRQLLIRQRTMLSNAIRGHLAELGIVAPLGRKGLAMLMKAIGDGQDTRIPLAARRCLAGLVRQYQVLQDEIGALEKHIHAWHRSSPLSSRLEKIPGIGPIVATALVASIPDAKMFSSGRNLAAWIGLVPKQHSSGGTPRLGGVSKQGNRYLRWLLVTGAMAVIRYANQQGFKSRPWLARLMERKPIRVAGVALANKMARMVWVVMARGGHYTQPALLAG